MQTVDALITRHQHAAQVARASLAAIDAGARLAVQYKANLTKEREAKRLAILAAGELLRDMSDSERQIKQKEHDDLCTNEKAVQRASRRILGELRGWAFAAPEILIDVPANIGLDLPDLRDVIDFRSLDDYVELTRIPEQVGEVYRAMDPETKQLCFLKGCKLPGDEKADVGRHSALARFQTEVCTQSWLQLTYPRLAFWRACDIATC